MSSNDSQGSLYDPGYAVAFLYDKEAGRCTEAGLYKTDSDNPNVRNLIERKTLDADGATQFDALPWPARVFTPSQIALPITWARPACPTCGQIPGGQINGLY